MNDKPLINPKNEKMLDLLVLNPPHGLVIYGPEGSGKTSYANMLLRRINPLLKPIIIKPEDSKMIGIEQIRELNTIMSRKSSSELVANAAIIVPADLMTEEAQNAILKTLEEPASGSIIVLLARQEGSLLPTVLSRCKKLKVLPVSLQQARLHYQDLDTADLDKKYSLSGGYPEALDILIREPDSQLVKNIHEAKSFISANKFDRLCYIEQNKDSATQLVNSLLLVARAAVEHIQDQKRLNKMVTIYKNISLAETQLNAKVNKKAVLTSLALSI